MTDLAAVYDETRQRISAVVASLDDTALNTPAPATPGWNVRDIVAHLTGDLAALLANELPATFFSNLGDADEQAKLNVWTERMVQERRGRSIAEVVDEWATLTPKAWSMLSSSGDNQLLGIADRIVTTDIAVHEQDIYGALDIVRERECAALRIATATYIGVMGLRLDGAGPVQFVTPEKTYQAGEGEPAATGRVDRFELFRALSGRRSPDQIRAWDWTCDSDPYLSLFYLYGPRPESLVES